MTCSKRCVLKSFILLCFFCIGLVPVALQGAKLQFTNPGQVEVANPRLTSSNDLEAILIDFFRNSEHLEDFGSNLES